MRQKQSDLPHVGFEKSPFFRIPQSQEWQPDTRQKEIPVLADRLILRRADKPRVLDSLELANVRDVDPNFSDTRPFAGQSPFVINFNLNYVNPESGWDGIIAFNYFDDRLSTTGVQGTPDIYERGRATLDFSISNHHPTLTCAYRWLV